MGAAAALPLIRNGESVGVLLVSRREPHSIDGQIVSMLERVSANISFALDNFEHEAARKNGERVMRRLNRMFGAISATNEAILRAKTEQELYQRVCDAAVHSGKSAATVVLLAEPDSIWLKPVAGTGAIVEQIMRAPFSIDAGNPYGTGVCGRAFRTQQPAVNNDILNSTQGQPWHQAARETGVTACVAVPLIKADESIGVLMFFVGKLWAEDEEIVALMARIAENVSFALDNFERAGEKARADAQKERLGRMLAALSATNEAIVRATSRTELFELVCEAAAKGGRFNSTSILLAGSDSDYTDMVAVAGPTADNMRRVKVSINADHPEGRGLCGNAFRARQACIANDLRADPRGSAFHQFIHSDGAMSGAAFPLLVSGRGRRRDVLHFLREGYVHAGIRRAAAAARRQRVVRDRDLRSGRREGADRKSERAPDADVRFAERDQRSHHAGQIPRRAVRSGVRGRGGRRQVYFDHHRIGRFRQRPAQDRRRLGSGGRDDAARQVVGG